MSKVPYRFQKTSIAAGARRHVFVADECGLGKTLTAIEIGRAMKRRHVEGVPWRALVVCPKSVRMQWIEEIREQDPNTEVVLLELHETPNLDSTAWNVTHYEAILRTPHAGLLWDLVVIDEAHRIKNRKTKTAAAIKRMSSIRRVALTATPMDKDPSEMWSIWNWLYPQEFSSYWRFRGRYCAMAYNYAGYPYVIGPKNLDHLAKRVRGRFFRHTKIEVADQLPEKIVVDVPLQMGPSQLALYEKIRKSRDIELEHNGGRLVIPNALSKIVRLQQAASLPRCLGDEFTEESVKVDWTIDFLDDNPELKVVVFAKFRKTALHVLQTLHRKKHSAVGFFGISPHNEFPEDFIKGRKRVLVATIGMAGEGMNLKDADVAIFIDQEWSSIKMQQAHDRIHRLGSKAEKKLLFVLLCSPVDRLVHEALAKKWSDTELVYTATHGGYLDGNS